MLYNWPTESVRDGLYRAQLPPVFPEGAEEEVVVEEAVFWPGAKAVNGFATVMSKILISCNASGSWRVLFEK